MGINLMTTNRPLRVFICHSKSDKKIVRDLYEKLRTEPWIQPWLDEEELYPGQDWELEIEKAVENSDVVLVCLSNGSINKRGYVQKELRFALDVALEIPEETIFVIPLRLEECTPPRSLRGWQYADYFEDQRERAFQKLLVSLTKRATSLGLDIEELKFKERESSTKVSIFKKEEKPVEEKKTFVEILLPKEEDKLNKEKSPSSVKVESISTRKTNSVNKHITQASIPHEKGGIKKDLSLMEIGVWGPVGSGKTTFISMLQYADCKGWSIKPRGKETQDLWIEYSEILRDRKEFVPPTIVDKIWYLTFDFEKPGGFFRNKSFHVVLPEVSGEYYEHPDMYPKFLREMSGYQGIIWLIDPERIDNPKAESRSYRRMIQEWAYRLHEAQGGGELKHRMAFCLTKMDLPQYRQFVDDPKNFCLDKLGTDVGKYLENFCDINNIGFFATSSIGVTPGTKKSNRNIEDPSKLVSFSNPLNLFDPFEWILNYY